MTDLYAVPRTLDVAEDKLEDVNPRNHGQCDGKPAPKSLPRIRILRRRYCSSLSCLCGLVELNSLRVALINGLEAAKDEGEADQSRASTAETKNAGHNGMLKHNAAIALRYQ